MTTRRIPWIVLAATLLVTVVLWFLVYRPAVAEEAALREQTAQLETQRSELTARLATLREIADNEERYREQVTQVSELIPSEPNQPEALRELQVAADAAGVEITELTFADPEIVEGAPETGDPLTALTRIPVQMSMTGGYFQVLDLLRRIETDVARAIRVDTVTLGEATELSFPQLTATWTGSVFAVLPITEAVEDDGTVAPDGESTDAPTEATTAPAAPDTDAETPAGDVDVEPGDADAPPPPPPGDTGGPPPPDGTQEGTS